MTRREHTVRDEHPISYTLRELMNQPEMANEVDELVSERDWLAARVKELEDTRLPALHKMSDVELEARVGRFTEDGTC